MGDSLSYLDNLLLTCICLGLFSSLKMELNFQRRSVYYLIQIYIPSGMIVVLSWVSVFLFRFTFAMPL